MKKLKTLNVIFTTNEDFMQELKKSFESKIKDTNLNSSISFDSIETYKRLMTSNKLEILLVVARHQPDSIYQLAKLIRREFPHVLKDCRSLEKFGFIKLIESDGPKKQFAPRLVFDYDVIRVHSKFEELLPISDESNKILMRSMVG
jgi:predicted transcriptional regulator